MRVLIPGGRVLLHQLTADRPFADRVPALPGPASVVTEVPVDRELLSWIEDAGFAQIRLVKFGGSPCFTADGVEMRETIIEALRSAETGSADDVLVVYKGPFRELIDDDGRVFRRGERTGIPAPVWESIKAGPLEEFFTCLKTQPVVRAV
jgi:arsenite methyltransferase